MKDIFNWDPIRIPVRLVDGQWEFFYGGQLPIENGSVGDLLLDRAAVSDKKFLSSIRRESKHKILNVDTELLVALTVKPDSKLNEALQKELIQVSDVELDQSYYLTPRPAETRLLRISIGGPTPQQERKNPDDKGGVWLHLKGFEPKGIVTSKVKIPKAVSETPADSLNHAFTLLSVVYETWRKSHTGNIYDRILYKEKNKKWCPLNVLRNAALADNEHQFIRDRWEEICASLNIQLKNK